MAKTKISEYSSTVVSNTDINNINIDEGCSPSGINNALRSVMGHLKDFQTGASGDSLTIGGSLSVTGTSTLLGSVTAPTAATTENSTVVATTQFVQSKISSVIPTGVIVLWYGSVASIPSGWYLCNGANGTPNLTDKFIVGAGSTYSVASTGGSADATLVSHTHTGSTSTASLTGSATYVAETWNSSGTATGIFSKVSGFTGGGTPSSTDSSPSGQLNIDASHSHTLTVNSTGSSATNANLPPYYALAYIMKA